MSRFLPRLFLGRKNFTAPVNPQPPEEKQRRAFSQRVCTYVPTMRDIIVSRARAQTFTVVSPVTRESARCVEWCNRSIKRHASARVYTVSQKKKFSWTTYIMPAYSARNSKRQNHRLSSESAGCVRTSHIHRWTSFLYTRNFSSASRWNTWRKCYGCFLIGSRKKTRAIADSTSARCGKFALGGKVFFVHFS